MVILLIIPAWILILSLIAGLCMAARLGDRQQQNSRAVRPGLELPEFAVVSRLSVEDTRAPIEPDGSAARSAA
jgi:hypothetical protein